MGIMGSDRKAPCGGRVPAPSRRRRCALPLTLFVRLMRPWLAALSGGDGMALCPLLQTMAWGVLPPAPLGAARPLMGTRALRADS